MKLISDKKIAKIKELAKKGMSQRNIAKKIGFSRSAVYYHLKK